MTILGQHTVAETRDLIRSQQFRINKNDQQWARIRTRRLNPPTAAQQKLDDEWIAFMRIWTETRDKQTLFLAAAIAANPNVNSAILPAESNFKAINEVTNVRIPHLKELEQLIDAEARELNIPPTDLSGIPAQNSPDADFAALQKLDGAIAAGGNPLGKPGGTDSVAKSPLGLALIGAAILVVAGGALYVKKVVF